MARYEVISKNESIISEQNCPVIITSYALTYDKEKDAILAQIKYKNLSDKEIVALYVNIACSGIGGEPLENIDEFVYLEINAAPGELFGANIPIYLLNKNTRHIRIQCNKIVFSDNRKWENICGSTYDIKHEKTDLINVFTGNNDLYEELERELKNDGISEPTLFIPYERNHIRLCVCGEFNSNTKDACQKCGKTIQWWEDKIDKTNLSDSLLQYTETLAINEKALLAQKEQRKNNIKKYSKLGLLCIAVLIIVVGIVKYIDYYSESNTLYNEALSYMDEDHNFSKAKRIFKNLGGFKDSKHYYESMDTIEADYWKNIDELYKTALSYYTSGDYTKALEIFEGIDDSYSDVSKYINYTKKLIIIEGALNECANKKYENAIEQLNTIDMVDADIEDKYNETEFVVYSSYAAFLCDSGDYRKSGNAIIEHISKEDLTEELNSILLKCGIFCYNSAETETAKLFLEYITDDYVVNNPDYIYYLGLCYCDLGDYQKSLDLINQYVEICNDKDVSSVLEEINANIDLENYNRSIELINSNKLKDAVSLLKTIETIDTNPLISFIESLPDGIYYTTSDSNDYLKIRTELNLDELKIESYTITMGRDNNYFNSTDEVEFYWHRSTYEFKREQNKIYTEYKPNNGIYFICTIVDSNTIKFESRNNDGSSREDANTYIKTDF